VVLESFKLFFGVDSECSRLPCLFTSFVLICSKVVVVATRYRASHGDHAAMFTPLRACCSPGYFPPSAAGS